MERTGNNGLIVVMRDSFVPKFICRLCKAQYGENEMHQFEHHVVRCAEEHHDAIMERSPRHSKFAQAPDPEWQAYNEALIAQGQDPMVQYSRGRKSNVRRARES